MCCSLHDEKTRQSSDLMHDKAYVDSDVIKPKILPKTRTIWTEFSNRASPRMQVVMKMF